MAIHPYRGEEVIAPYLTDNNVTVRAIVSPDGASASFLCPFCNENHTHGTEGGQGYRASHCSKQPQPFPQGYFLEFIGAEPDDEAGR